MDDHPQKQTCVLLLLFTAALVGCATPSSRFDAYASSYELEKSVVFGMAFQHAIYQRMSGSTDGRVLHVYLGSDGTPWSDNRPTLDPTPRNPLTLRLMVADDKPFIYVGRPCYHGLSANPECREKFWTSARYSKPIIESMARVIENFAGSAGYDSINLIGYSGGGVIAVLTAERINSVKTLITIAANLDIDTWAEYHGYDPLTESINPALQAPVRPTVQQLHLFGANDRFVPPKTTERFFENNSEASRRSYPGFDHRCCWEKIWGELIGEITNE